MRRLFIVTFMAIATTLVVVPRMLDLFFKQGNIENRIMRRHPAVPGQFPWQAAIHLTTPAGVLFCGGALISPQWILTAGHCTAGASSFLIRLGGVTLNVVENGREDIWTVTKIVHQNYNSSNFNYDIALIKLPYPVQLTARIQTIQLPARGRVVGVGEHLTLSGHGYTTDVNLQQVSNWLNFVPLQSISNKDCSDVYGPATVIPTTVCCRGYLSQNACQGDSGGPLVYLQNGRAIHVGVVSFVCCGGCALGKPSGYVRTESFLDWINQNTGIPV